MSLKKQTKFFRYVLPLAFYIALLLFLSSTPGDRFPSLFSGADKIVHFILYTFLGLLISRFVFHWRKPENLRFAQTIGLLGAFAYGCWDEYFQSFTPGRYVESADLIANFLGATFGAYLMPYYLRLRERIIRP